MSVGLARFAMPVAILATVVTVPMVTVEGSARLCRGVGSLYDSSGRLPVVEVVAEVPRLVLPEVQVVAPRMAAEASDMCKGSFRAVSEPGAVERAGDPVSRGVLPLVEVRAQRPAGTYQLGFVRDGFSNVN